jgi:multimeric flavodoxin WrbA
MRILGIRGSPRKGSNSTALLEYLLAGARSEGAETQIITPWRLKIKPCLACDGCVDDGLCIVPDDFQSVHAQILDSDALVVATPVYFGAVSAQLKSLIDRCESFWNQTYILKEPVPPGPAGGRRRGVLIATAGQDREIMFTGPKVTFDFLMRSLQGEVFGELLYGAMDEPRAIAQNETAMARAFAMGQALAGSIADDR